MIGSRRFRCGFAAVFGGMPHFGIGDPRSVDEEVRHIDRKECQHPETPPDRRHGQNGSDDSGGYRFGEADLSMQTLRHSFPLVWEKQESELLK